MNVVRKALSALGIIFLAALLIASLAPRAARGVAAALVQVTNTTADPVPNRDVDDRDRATIEYVSCFVQNTGGEGEFVNSSCSTVPAGQRFVIDQIDGYCFTSLGNTVVTPFFTFISGGNGVVAYLVLTPQATQFGAVNYNFNQAVHYIVDSGSTISFGASTTDKAGLTACQSDFSGHLVSYP